MLTAGWLERPGTEELTSYLARRGHVLFEVDVRDRQMMSNAARIDRASGTMPSDSSVGGPRGSFLGGADQAKIAASSSAAAKSQRSLKGPNYLAQFRAFVRGE
jgi:hypothetical protein